MSDNDTDAKALAEAHERILAMFDDLGARLSRIEKLIEEIRDTIAMAKAEPGGEKK